MLIPLLVVLAAAPAPAPIRLASPEWTTVNMPPELGAFYSEEMARALRKEGLEIITARDIAALLGMERQKQILGCSEGAASCMAELGAALGCDRVLLGQLARLDDSYRGTIRVISSTSGIALAEEPVEASGQKALVSELERAAHRIAVKLKPPEPVTPVNVTWLPFVLGGAFAAGSAISFGVAGSNAAQISQQSVERDAVNLANTGKTLEVLGWVGAGAATAALATGVVLAITREKPAVTPAVSVTSTSASIGVRGTW